MASSQSPDIPANLYANELSLPIQTNISSDPQDYNKISFLFSTQNQIKNHKMMNVLALGLVLTSLVTAGFFTPSPQPKPREDVIVKEGHRVVVVEYEKDDGNTKVLISPQDSQTTNQRADEKGFLANANDRLSEEVGNVKEGVKEGAASVLDEVGEVGNHAFRPRELVCDAYGKCRHKIASAFGKTKEATAEKAHDVAEAAREAAGKVKETVTQTAHKATEKVLEAKDNVKDSANEVSSKAKEKVSEKTGRVKEEAARKMEGAKEMAAEKARAAEEAVESARRVRKEGQKELREILRHARDVAGDVFDYVAPRETVAPVAGVLHLMGFSAAYGMCVWITFASSYVLAGALPRQQFAMVQSKIYPVYFKAMAYSVGMALLGHLMGPSRRLSPASVVVFQGLNLVSSLAMILTNLLWLEPRATKV